MPTLASPGEVAPGQLADQARAGGDSSTGIMSSAGMPSVMQKIVEMPATDSRTASGRPPPARRCDVLAPVADRLAHGIEHGILPSLPTAALPGRRAGDGASYSTIARL